MECEEATVLQIPPGSHVTVEKCQYIVRGERNVALKDMLHDQCGKDIPIIRETVNDVHAHTCKSCESPHFDMYRQVMGGGPYIWLIKQLI